MSTAKDGHTRRTFEVPDPAQAIHNMEALARRVLKVPKKEIAIAKTKRKITQKPRA